MAQEKRYQSFWVSLFKWKLDEKELKNQIENYNTLGFFKALKKISAGLIMLAVILNIIFITAGYLDADAWVDTLIWIILAIFVYRGRRWAIIITIILWTFEKGYQFYGITQGGSGNIVVLIIWWAAYTDIFWKTYQVEKERKKIGKDNLISQNSNIFCNKCGAQTDADSKFCVKCGNKIASIP